MSNIPYLSISINGSIHFSIKNFSILVQYFDASNGIQVKLIELKSITNETSETISILLIRTLNKYNQKNKCVAFVGDNTNTNFG